MCSTAVQTWKKTPVLPETREDCAGLAFSPTAFLPLQTLAENRTLLYSYIQRALKMQGSQNGFRFQQIVLVFILNLSDSFFKHP